MTALAVLLIVGAAILAVDALFDLKISSAKRREFRRLKHLERGRAQQRANQGPTPWERRA